MEIVLTLSRCWLSQQTSVDCIFDFLLRNSMGDSIDPAQRTALCSAKKHNVEGPDPRRIHFGFFVVY
jgi:hypothetical protein